MLSDKVEVKTVYYKEHVMNHISFERNSEYICLSYENTARPQGTEIILDYDQCLSRFDNNPQSLISFIESNFLDCGIPIKISTMEGGKSTPLECNVKKVETIIADNICISQYLNNIEAYIDCNYKQINFAKKISDINGCESYCYNEKIDLLEKESIPIKKCVKEGKIKLLNLPIITEDNEEDFLKAYDVLDDYDEALNTLGYYESINIWADQDESEYILSPFEETTGYIVGEYTVENFREEFQHASEIPVYVNPVEQGIIVGESDEVLPYNEECTFNDMYIWKNTDACYMKNVLLSALHIRIPYLVDGITLKGAVIDIFNEKFIPNVSRNNVNISQQEALSYAIGKAIHLWIRDNAKLTVEQKRLLEIFIETKYKDTNYCLK